MNLKYVILPLLLLFILGCVSKPAQLVQSEQSHFEISFKVDNANQENPILSFSIDLDTGFYYVSPYSEGFHQRLLFSLEKSGSLELKGELLESPRSIWEYDEFSKKEGLFVRTSTTYSQELYIHSSNDFKIKGLIWLGLLPINQPYEVNFNLSYASEELQVKDVRTTPSTYPTFYDNKRLD